jgi:hypothetical protein
MSKPSEKTDMADLLGQLNAGVFEQQVNRVMSDLAANVVTHGKKGKVVLTFSMKQIAESNQVHVTHAIKSEIPTMRGRIIEEHTTDTPLHVGRGGTLSIFPDNQTKMDMGAGAATGQPDGARTQ